MSKTSKTDLYTNLSRDNLKHAKVWKFIDEYPKDLNATQAAIRAGYSRRAARTTGAQLLANPAIKKEIDSNLAEIARRNKVEQDQIVQNWVRVLNTDVRKFCTVTVHCCRHCHDEEFRYQFLPEEFEQARKAHDHRQKERAIQIKGYEKEPFDERGGPNYDIRKNPSPECRVCGGHGISEVVFRDLEQLAGEDAQILMGVERSRSGPRLILMDKMKALDALSRYTGLYDKEKEDEHRMPTKEELMALHNTMQDSIARNMEVVKRRKAILDEARKEMESYWAR